MRVKLCMNNSFFSHLDGKEGVVVGTHTLGPKHGQLIVRLDEVCASPWSPDEIRYAFAEIAEVRMISDEARRAQLVGDTHQDEIDDANAGHP